MRALYLPPTVDLGRADHSLAAGSPECVVSQDGNELPCRYERGRDWQVIILAVKVNGYWHDPAAMGFSEATVRVWEDEVSAIERDLEAAS